MANIVKRTFSMMVVLLLVFSSVGCGKQQEPQADPNSNSLDTAAEQAKEDAKKTGFSWEMAKGAKIKVLLNQHPYAEAVIKKIPDFEEKTGIKVEYSITPEENYFDKVTTSLNSRSGDPDIFMTGAYQVWEYAPAGYIQPLDEFINDSNLTASDYNFEDFYKGIVGALKWDLTPGHKTGSGSQWALPMGFEQYTLAYNKRIFAEKGLEAPKTIEELMDLCKKLNEFDGKGTYALALRGTRNWATIHPGYMTTFVNYGAKDFEVEEGKLVSKLNSKEAVEMTDTWVKLIKSGGSPSWSSYTWYQASADLGAGKAAMLFDADVVEYFQNPEGASKEAGNLAWVPAPLPEGKNQVNSNLWTWALAMNKASKNKQAAWLFLQYFTGKDYQLWASVNANLVNPVRNSVFEDPSFAAIIEKADGYAQTFKKTIDGTTIQFTPQPHFFETTTEWAATLQDLVGGKYKSTQEAMDALKAKIDKIVEDVEVE
ncbi:sugar ABC transporter substrate-binding protein [Petroclostridium sp. X23]|uniref:ABC transporter substrate-binding protein n=1 Tax=Petroclostridium sp. X23 TaxID=3045146 RepID=UPI0024AD1387|nr:sugar ABC transporter substrate-binding protein [Petroclostridium sp. X23]WHH61121.1 sugar ABC transporter substrate-binding protein [Petroclostridium sp. X23]